MAERGKRRFIEPTKYKVGEDLTREAYDEIIRKMGDFYAQTRKTKEPNTLAEQELQYCLDGVTKSGQPWFSMAQSSLAARVRSMCRFDIEKLTPLTNASDRQRAKKEKEKDRKRKREADSRIPEEFRKEQAKNLVYGEDVGVLLSSAEERRWKKLRADYIREHPQLDSVSAQAELDQLCDLVIINERYRMKMLAGEKVDLQERGNVGDDIQKLKKALGIHPDQLAKRVQAKTETTIAEAAKRLSADEFRNVRARFFLEEMLQAFQMYMTVSADGLSYQLDDVGLFGLAKSRVVECPKCRTKNFAGFDITEIEAWLVSQGVLRKLEDGEPTVPPNLREGADEPLLTLDAIDVDEVEADAGS